MTNDFSIKPITTKTCAKSPAKRGDVFPGRVAKPQNRFSDTRSVVLRTRVSGDEYEAVKGLAKAAGVSVSELVRRDVLKGGELGSEADRLMVRIGRLEEVVAKLAVALGVEASQVDQIRAKVQAMDGRVLGGQRA